MNSKQFYTQLGLVSTFVAVGLVLLNLSEIFAIHQLFSWICWATYVAFCAALYSTSAKTIQSNDKTLFSKVFLVSIMVKMFLSLLLIIAYVLISQTKDKYFVFPFFLIYLVFTVFEVYFITKLAKS